jgi:hypothetical protein
MCVCVRARPRNISLSLSLSLSLSRARALSLSSLSLSPLPVSPLSLSSLSLSLSLCRYACAALKIRTYASLHTQTHACAHAHHTSIPNPDANYPRTQSLDSELSNHKQAKADPGSKVEVLPTVYHSVSTSPLVSSFYEKNKVESPRSNRFPPPPPVLAPQASKQEFKRVPAVALWDYTPVHPDEMSLVKVSFQYTISTHE